MKRYKTEYPGVFYRIVDRVGRPGKEKMYYVVFKKDGKFFEEKAGRQYADDMTPSRAARFRAERIEGKRSSRKEIREQETALREATNNIYTIERLWNEFKELKDMKSICVEEYRYKKYLEPYFKDKEPKDIVPMDIERLKRKALKGMSPQTVKLTLSLIRRLVNFGIKKKLCEPMSFKIEMPKVNNIKTEDLTEDQMKNLMRILSEEKNIMIANLMKMALFSGMRRGELYKLKWEHINFEKGYITLEDPKGGTNQTIPLNEITRELLESHPRTEGSPYVFPGRKGEKRVEAKRVLNRIKDLAGLPKNFRPLHGLRHTFASALASSGQVDMYTLQKLLTHKSPQMTQRYAHLRDATLRQASNIMGEILNNLGKAEKESAENV